MLSATQPETNMKTNKYALAAVLALIPNLAFAFVGSYRSTWPNISVRKELDALACGVAPLLRTDQDHYCASTSAWTSGNYAAECRFVMEFTGIKTVWHLEGNYNSTPTGQDFKGTVWQTLPTCTGFVCGYIGTITWYGRSPMPPQLYEYEWNTGNAAECAVDRFNGQVQGQFYGSY